MRGQTATVLHLSRGQGDYKVGEQLFVVLVEFSPKFPLVSMLCVCSFETSNIIFQDAVHLENPPCSAGDSWLDLR